MKMKRRTIRKHVFKMVFRYEFHDASEMSEQDQLYLDNVEGITEEEYAYISERANNVIDKLDEIDRIITECATGWTFERIAKVELAILRLAIYEIKFDDDIPVNVAVNEAIEIAKEYGGENAPSFINGVLAKVIN